ncbi:MAG: RagB/SusD family nutrient uptake outer membrane protein [Chitinophagales bacterium]
MKNKLFLVVCILFFTTTSCEKDFLDTVPENTISNLQLAENPAALQAIINGVYANLRTYGVSGTTFHVDYGHMGVKVALDMMGQDMTMSAFHWYAFFNNYDGRVQTSSRTRLIWNTYYQQIAEVNSVIAAIDAGTTDPTAKALLGQALAMRGLFSHVLARVYSHTYIGHESDMSIPLPNGENFEGKPRATVGEAYTQMASDLEAAITLLEGFDRSTKQEVNQAVAQGFLAAVYLEMGNWSGAASMANAARSAYAPMSSSEWMDGFSNINNAEWMWGADIDNESSTSFASFFSHFDNTVGGYAGALGVYKLIDANLYSMIPDSDIRKSAFVHPVDLNPDYPVLPAYANIKFRDASSSSFEGDYVYMRAAEMYLIEAEALARSGDNAGGAQVLFDLVSTKDPEYTLSTATGDDLVEEVYLNRRIELWGEGTGWFDLKRLKKPLVRDYEGTNHASFGIYNFEPEANPFRFQLPEDEINANDAISAGDQNPN